MTAEKCSQCGVKKSYAEAAASGKIQHVTNSYVNPGTSMEVKSEKVLDRVSPYETEPREDIKHVEKALATFLESAMSVGDTFFFYESERGVETRHRQITPVGKPIGYIQKCFGACHDTSCRLCAQNSKKRNVPYKMYTQIST